MAIEVERLVAVLEARLDKYEKALKKAQGVTDQSFNRIERRGKQMESRLSAIGKGFSTAWIKAFAAIGAARGFQQLLDASTRIENALKVAGLEGENLTQVYDRLFESAQRNAAPLESLVELYGRASLVQKELGITSEELLGFTDKVAVALRVSGKSAAESSGALLQLSQALGSGIVRAEEFNSILEGALPIAQAAAHGLEEAGGSVAKLRELVVEGKVSSEAFFRAFEAGSSILETKVANAELTVSQGFTRLTNTLIKTAGQFDEATGASDAVADALGRLAAAIEVVGNAFEENAEKAQAFFNLVRQGIGLIPGIGAVVGGPQLPPGYVPPFADPGSAVLPSGPRGRGGRRGGSGTTKTVSLEDFALPAGSKKSGAAKVGEDLKLASAYAEELARQHDELVASVQEFGNAASSVITGFISDLRSGTSAADAFTNALNKIADQLISMAVNNLIQSALGGIFSPAMGLGAGAVGRGVYGGSGGFFPGFPGRASGGPVQAGRPYVVGENRPELFVPSTAGRILPRVPSNGMGGATTNNFYIDAKGAEIGVEEKIARAIRATVPQMIRTQAPAASANAQRNRNLG